MFGIINRVAPYLSGLSQIIEITKVGSILEIESIFSQPVARFVLRVCISIAGYFAQSFWKRPVVRRSYIPAFTVSGD